MSNLTTYLAQVKERAESATEGPWVADSYYVWKQDPKNPNYWVHMVSDLADENDSITRARGTGYGLSDLQQSANLHYISHARTDIPVLLEMVEYLIKDILEHAVTSHRTNRVDQKLTTLIPGGDE